MGKPTADSVRKIVEGYGIDSTIISDGWIDDCITEEVLPHVEDVTGLSFSGVETVTEYCSGTGSDILILSRRPVISVESITYIGVSGNFVASIELLSGEGIIRSKVNLTEGLMGNYFSKGKKNIKVVYTCGYVDADMPVRIVRAIKNITASRMLNTIGARTGGGSVSVQAFSRNYGNAGKYMDIRKELVSMAYSLLRKYTTGVIGS